MRSANYSMFSAVLAILGLSLLTISCEKQHNITPEAPNTPSFKSFTIIEDEVAGVPIIVIGSQNKNVVVAFERELNGEQFSAKSLEGAFPVIMEDATGTRWDIFGKAVSGPNSGAQLKTVNSNMGYWFIFSALYPGIEIYNEGGLDIETNYDLSGPWGIPKDFIFQGSGFDAISSLENPRFINFNAQSLDPSKPFYVQDKDLIVAVSLNGETKLYPHGILDHHELVNDIVGGVPISVTYCPLAGTTKVIKRKSASQDHTFGVSGFLYNNSLIPYDRETESYWTQLDAKCVFGPSKGQQKEIVPSIETTWETWRLFDAHPDVMSDDTGQNIDYSIYPYGEYKEADYVAFPLAYDDARKHKKERVFGVMIGTDAKVYPLDKF